MLDADQDACYLDHLQTYMKHDLVIIDSCILSSYDIINFRQSKIWNILNLYDWIL